MNRSNECHLCNVAHYGDLNRRCNIGLRPSFALLFYVQVGIQAQNRLLHHKMPQNAIYSSTSSCILSVATGGAIASCSIAELTNNLLFPSEDPKEWHLTLWLQWSQTAAAVDPLRHAVCLLASYRGRSQCNHSVESQRASKRYSKEVLLELSCKIITKV